MNETIKKIKTEFRLAMNGVASQSMREKGSPYKVIFGIELPRLQQIAGEFPKSHELAGYLWKENIRESKIMATMLQPIESFYPEIADIWVEQMPAHDIADIAVMNLFQHLPYASDKAFIWVAADEEMFQYCGWMLMARIMMRRPEMTEETENELTDQLAAALLSTDSHIARAATICAQRYVAIGKDQRGRLSRLIAHFRTSDNTAEQSAYEQIFA